MLDGLSVGQRVTSRATQIDGAEIKNLAAPSCRRLPP